MPSLFYEKEIIQIYQLIRFFYRYNFTVGNIFCMFRILIFAEPGKFQMKPEMKKVSIDLFMGWLKRNMLLVITFTGVSLGVMVGLLLRKYQLDSVTVSYIAYPGELFMRLLKLMILPLIIASLITGQ